MPFSKHKSHIQVMIATIKSKEKKFEKSKSDIFLDQRTAYEDWNIYCLYFLSVLPH